MFLSQSIGMRTTINFGSRELEMNELFSNINDKLRDIGAFVDNLRLES